jgi:hypothetical protein
MMRLIDTQAVVAMLATSPRPVTAATVRDWARRGCVTVRGHDSRGRALFDVREIYEFANSRHPSGPKPRQEMLA